MLRKKILLGVSICLFLLFIFYSYLVAKEVFTQMDFDTTVKFQDRIPRKADLPFSILSIIGSAEISMTIWALLVIYALIRRYWLALFTLWLLPFALFMEIFGKLYVHHPSPPYLFYRGVLKYEFSLYHSNTDYSYPSGHMLRITFIVAFLMTYLLIKFPKPYTIFIQIGLLLFFIMMFISRIYLGEHWASDVIGGSLLGASFGILAALVIPTKKKFLPKFWKHESSTELDSTNH